MKHGCVYTNYLGGVKMALVSALHNVKLAQLLYMLTIQNQHIQPRLKNYFLLLYPLKLNILTEHNVYSIFIYNL